MLRPSGWRPQYRTIRACFQTGWTRNCRIQPGRGPSAPEAPTFGNHRDASGLSPHRTGVLLAASARGVPSAAYLGRRRAIELEPACLISRPRVWASRPAPGGWSDRGPLCCRKRGVEPAVQRWYRRGPHTGFPSSRKQFANARLHRRVGHVARNSTREVPACGRDTNLSTGLRQHAGGGGECRLRRQLCAVRRPRRLAPSRPGGEGRGSRGHRARPVPRDAQVDRITPPDDALEAWPDAAGP